MPQKKKHSSTRARRNKASTAATLQPVEATDYSTWTLAQLRQEIDRRNEGRADDERLSKRGAKAVLAERLADDELGVPELPARAAGWHEQTRRWWNDVWTSPMSNEWHLETDIHNVIAAAMHYDDIWNATTAAERQKADAAFQKREAALGLTPYDRRRLEWTIASAAEAAGRVARRSNGSPAKQPDEGGPKKRGKDPRAHLSAVS